VLPKEVPSVENNTEPFLISNEGRSKQYYERGFSLLIKFDRIKNRVLSLIRAVILNHTLLRKFKFAWTPIFRKLEKRFSVEKP